MHVISGAFINFRKATVSYVMPVRLSTPLCVRLSVRMEQLGSHWTDFDEIWDLRIFENVSGKIQLLLK